MAHKKIRILCYTGYYLPGYKAGGVLRTISNLTDHLGNEFDFYIITRDRDLGDIVPFDDLKINTWSKINNANVMYIDSTKLSLQTLQKASTSINYDLIYLNSFFDKYFTIYPILINFLNGRVKKPIILATRGELSPAALKIKWLKKKIFLFTSKIFNFHKGITFQASSNHEKNDILRSINVSEDRIKVALDLPAINIRTNKPYHNRNTNPNNNHLNIIFLSRISPIKNLDFAIRALSEIRSSISFDIYGPIEDVSYWNLCKTLISKLPNNISANYHGEVMPSDVPSKLSNYDLLFLPSKGENYGHVIVESLSAGTPVLISDNTPWKNLQSLGIGWDLSLNSINIFSETIVKFSENQSRKESEFRDQIINNSKNLFLSKDILDSNKDLFLSLYNQK